MNKEQTKSLKAAEAELSKLLQQHCFRDTPRCCIERALVNVRAALSNSEGEPTPDPKLILAVQLGQLMAKALPDVSLVDIAGQLVELESFRVGVSWLDIHRHLCAKFPDRAAQEDLQRPDTAGLNSPR